MTHTDTGECSTFQELVAACEEKDVDKFTEVLTDYDSLSPLVSLLLTAITWYLIGIDFLFATPQSKK